MPRSFHRIFSLFGLCSAFAMALAAAPQAKADGIFDETRFGVYEHDASFLGHQKETGADIGLEEVFVSPDILSGIGAPRPVIGMLINSAGETDQYYIGLTWTWNFVSDVFTSGDGFYVEGTLGGAYHDGYLDIPGDSPLAQKRKSLGSNVLFREDADFGYHFTQWLSLAFSIEHISDADLAKRNEGLNDVGLRFGVRF